MVLPQLERSSRLEVEAADLSLIASLVSLGQVATSIILMDRS